MPCEAAEPSFYGGDSEEPGPGSWPRGVSGDTAIVPAWVEGSFFGKDWVPVGAPTMSWADPHWIQGCELMGLSPA